MRRAVRFDSRPVQGHGLLLLYICYQNYNVAGILHTFVQPMTVEFIFLQFFSSEIQAVESESKTLKHRLGRVVF